MGYCCAWFCIDVSWCVLVFLVVFGCVLWCVLLFVVYLCIVVRCGVLVCDVVVLRAIVACCVWLIGVVCFVPSFLCVRGLVLVRARCRWSLCVVVCC